MVKSLAVPDAHRCEAQTPPNTYKADAQKLRVAELCRVCRAWHRTCEVKVLTPGVNGAEGKEKGKGVVVRRGLEEAQSKSAGRRTETG